MLRLRTRPRRRSEDPDTDDYRHWRSGSLSEKESCRFRRCICREGARGRFCVPDASRDSGLAPADTPLRCSTRPRAMIDELKR